MCFAREAKMQKDFRTKTQSFDDMVETLRLDEDMEEYYIDQRERRSIEIRERDADQIRREREIKGRLDEWAEIWEQDKDECMQYLHRSYKEAGFSDHMASVKVDVMIVKIAMYLKAQKGADEVVEEVEEEVPWDDEETERFVKKYTVLDEDDEE